jgi:hypothetical protein
MDVRQRYDTHTSTQQQQHHHQQRRSASASYEEAMVPANLKLVELRTELKKRGLSPSGLKHVLVKRLEDALADPAAFPAINRPPPPSSSSSVTARAKQLHHHQQLQHHHLPLQQLSRRQHSPHGSDDAADNDGEEDDLRNALEEGEDGDERGGEHNNNNYDEEDEDAAGEEDESYFDAGDAFAGVRHPLHPNNTSSRSDSTLWSKKRKSPPSSSSSTSPSSSTSSSFSATRTSNSRRRHHQHQEKKLKKKHHAASSSLSLLSAGAPSTESSPLSGFAFVKEARYAKQQQQQQQQEDGAEEIKSLEQFRFEGSAFFFSYQFWRGRTLLHSFDIEAGTFFLVDGQDNTLNTADNTNTTTTPSHPQQRKVVLRWPSPVYYPLLQTWRFHQTYSHLHLLHAPATTSGAGAAPVSSTVAASTSPLALPPPTCATGGLCLVSRLGSVFVQEE